MTAITRIYIASAKPLEEEPAYKIAFDAVTDVRREKTRRMRIASDRALSLGAEILLFRALKDCGLRDIVPEYGYGDNEKPYLKNVPGFHFNISHSKEYVMCAASETEIGCDIEKIARADMKVAKRFYCPEEYERICSAGSEEEANALFFRLWTLKESFIKTVGKGLAIPLNSFHLSLDDRGVTVRDPSDNALYSFEETDRIPGYKCSVCQKGDFFRSEIEIVDLGSEITAGK